jgi:outer membrane lipoprotein-sorting protein
LDYPLQVRPKRGFALVTLPRIRAKQVERSGDADSRRETEGISMRVGCFALALAVAVACCPAHASDNPQKSGPKTAPRLSATPEPGVALRRANAFLNGSKLVTADFVQTGPDGRKSQGKLYLNKPGLVRFQYALPSNMAVIADGSVVAILDTKLKTKDRYFIDQTPLKFLLNANIDLTRDLNVVNVLSDQFDTSITIEDTANFSGSTRIKLTFDNRDFALKQWVVTDSQGLDTKVALFNVDYVSVPDPALFKIPVDTPW